MSNLGGSLDNGVLSEPDSKQIGNYMPHKMARTQTTIVHPLFTQWTQVGRRETQSLPEGTEPTISPQQKMSKAVYRGIAYDTDVAKQEYADWYNQTHRPCINSEVTK